MRRAELEAAYARLGTLVHDDALFADLVAHAWRPTPPGPPAAPHISSATAAQPVSGPAAPKSAGGRPLVAAAAAAAVGRAAGGGGEA